MALRKKQTWPRNQALESSRVGQRKYVLARPKSTKEAQKVARSRLLAEQLKNIPATLIGNGLTSMEVTPEPLVKIVNRNATRSPLLRVPGEIRNKIWKYAMGGNYIAVPGDYDTDPKGSAVSHPTWPTTRPFSAFHLPEVCRQIYSETATLAYKHNTFVIGYGIARENKKWTKRLLPAQREAITSLAPTDEFLETCVSGMYKKALKETFPGLEHVHVTAGAVRLVKSFMYHHLDSERKMTTAQWQELIVKRIRGREGENIEVEFGEKVDLEAWRNANRSDWNAFWADVPLLA